MENVDFCYTCVGHVSMQTGVEPIFRHLCGRRVSLLSTDVPTSLKQMQSLSLLFSRTAADHHRLFVCPHFFLFAFLLPFLAVPTAISDVDPMLLNDFATGTRACLTYRCTSSRDLVHQLLQL